MEYEITGDNLQLVTLHLQGGETVYAEAGAMNHMSSWKVSIHREQKKLKKAQYIVNTHLSF
jgi:uncharacterized protein (AIM24 family)